MTGPILVTGASGFIGRNLLLALSAHGHSIHALGNTRQGPPLPGVQWHRARLPDGIAPLVDHIRPGLVFHCATARLPEAERQQLFTTNVLGAHHLIESCRARPETRVVVLGSSIEYGHRDAPLHERLADRPTTSHGATKAAATQLFLQAAAAGHLRATVLRLFSVYGPLAPPSKLIPTVLRACRTGEPISLTQDENTRDRVWVGDVVQAVLAASEREQTVGELINVGTGTPTRNQDVVRLVSELSGRPITIDRTPFKARQTDSRHWVADTTHCKTMLGEVPSTSLREGLRRLLEAQDGP
ncbi:MAG: NAD(P)-dependent oxidoreductase [Proteobacteria bacterium]|nr:NAD(P)-dependent oxidoreductase [Pseudomonadota bacterium]